MKQLMTLIFAGILGLPAAAQETDTSVETPVAAPYIVSAGDLTLADFLWLNRVIVVFADTDRDPAFQKQMDLLNVRPLDLIERELIIITDTDPSAKSAIRTELRPRGFSLVLIDLDGRVKLRKPSPWSVRELVHSVDKSTIRREEIRNDMGE